MEEAEGGKQKFVPPVTATAQGKSVQAPPTREEYTIHAPDGISTADLELMKVAAQFVARNGKAFMTSLASKEEANPKFGFLRAKHSLHKFFMAMCAAYSKVLMPPDDLLITLKKDSLSKLPACSARSGGWNMSGSGIRRRKRSDDRRRRSGRRSCRRIGRPLWWWRRSSLNWVRRLGCHVR